MRRIIMHLDMDAFYAAVEQRERPELRGKPIVVGGSPDSRSVVSSASYEARAFGVRSAMPCAEARRLCPDVLFVPVRMELYAAASRQLMGILDTFTPTIEPLSIDEAFLDMSGTEQLYGPPWEMGRKVKEAVGEALGLTASVGVAPNKLVAKLASEADKPDGLVVVSEEEVQSFLGPMPVGRLWGVGHATEKRLHNLGIRTIGDLAAYPRPLLVQSLGQGAGQLHDLANGIDRGPVVTSREAKSISSETTFDRDISDKEQLDGVLFDLAEQVAWRLRDQGVLARTLTLKVRFADFRTITRARSLGNPTNHGPEIHGVAAGLMREAPIGSRAVRLLGVAGSQLVREQGERQLSLFDDDTAQARAADEALDGIARRFGPGAVVRARSLGRERPP